MTKDRDGGADRAAGSVELAVFADFGAYFAVGDRSLRFDARDATDSVDFDFEIEPWLIQAGIGLRLSWVGFE